MISRVDRFKNHTCLNIDELDKENIYRQFYKITKYTQQVCNYNKVDFSGNKTSKESLWVYSFVTSTSLEATVNGVLLPFKIFHSFSCLLYRHVTILALVRPNFKNVVVLNILIHLILPHVMHLIQQLVSVIVLYTITKHISQGTLKKKNNAKK